MGDGRVGDGGSAAVRTAAAALRRVYACACACCALVWGAAGGIDAKAQHGSVPPAHVVGAPDRASFADPPVADVDKLLSAAESALAAGETAAATSLFERAAAMRHSADIELGLVRAHLQAGRYRQALAFCAHAAGAHPDRPAAAALYGWLLQAGGQGAYGRQLVAQAGVRAPADPVVAEAARQLDSASPRATGVLLQAPHRMAPHSIIQDAQADVPGSARVVSNGVLIDSGRQALVALSDAIGAAGAVDLDRRLWVRNGLGRTTRASVDPSRPELWAHGIAVVRLDAPLPVAGDLGNAPRAPFAGSPGFIVEYASGVDAAPAWPRLRQGFFALERTGAGARPLGIDVAAGSNGAPVFDLAGRLAGVAITAPASAPMMLPVSLWSGPAQPLAQATATAATAAAPGTRRIAADEIYERALALAVQVIAAN